MAHAAEIDPPPSALNIYQPAGLVLLVLLALVGPGIAVLDALGPAGWPTG